jgi:DNA (cytosine-5)-methyltransferase 1
LRMVNTANQSDSARYRQLGNAVCVPVAEWIGRRIVEAS